MLKVLTRRQVLREGVTPPKLMCQVLGVTPPAACASCWGGASVGLLESSEMPSTQSVVRQLQVLSLDDVPPPPPPHPHVHVYHHRAARRRAASPQSFPTHVCDAALRTVEYVHCGVASPPTRTM